MSLRRDNGKTLKVPLAKLSKEDQEYVLDQPKPKAEPVAVREEKSVAALEELGAKIVKHPQGGIGVVYLNDTQVTDAGVVHLGGLTSLRFLHLNNTQITDAGLVHLKALTSLQVLSLDNTQVTDAGVAKLKEALPDCRISR